MAFGNSNLTAGILVGKSFGAALLFGTSRKEEEAHLFGTLTMDQTSPHKLVFGGSIVLYREHMKNVLHDYPINIHYDCTGPET